MTRRTTRAAEAASAEASEAARVLAQRSHEVKSEAVEVVEQATEREVTSPDRVEKLLNARPHAQAMDEITKKRGLDDEPEEKAAEPVVEAKAEPEAAKPAETSATVEVQPEAPKTVRVKVDGEEFDADAAEVEEAGGVRSYQLQKASENRLNKTNAALEETRKAQAQIAEFLQKQAQANVKPEPTDDQYIQERIDKIRFGTPEESTVALREIMSRGQQKIDPQTITNQITARIAHDAATKQFDTEFADLAANPILLNAVLAQRQSKLAKMQSPPVDWVSFYRNIGNEVRSAFGRQSQPATTTDKTASTTSSASDKEARKASILTLPTAAARAELPKEEKELTPEEERKQWIAEQKKARGLG